MSIVKVMQSDEDGWTITVDGAPIALTFRAHYDAWEVLAGTQSALGFTGAWQLTPDGGFETTIL